MIVYDRLFELMKAQGKTKQDIRDQKIIGQETLRKLRIGTGIYEEYLYGAKEDKSIKVRENSIDTKSIEALCTWLNCQPSDIMEVIPNRWENAKRLKEILNCQNADLLKKLPMPDPFEPINAASPEDVARGERLKAIFADDPVYKRVIMEEKTGSIIETQYSSTPL